MRKYVVMVDDHSNSVNNPTKWSYPLTKVLGDMKKFMKKEGGEDRSLFLLRYLKTR